MDSCGPGDRDEGMNSGDKLFRRIIEVIGETAEEDENGMSKFEIIGCLECVKLAISGGINAIGLDGDDDEDIDGFPGIQDN
jgi:hypothetical protein